MKNRFHNKIKKRDKLFLILTALIILIAWLTPFIFRFLNKKEIKEQTKTKGYGYDIPVENLNKYLSDLLKKENSEIAKKIEKNIPEEYLGFSGYEIIDGSFNGDKAKFNAKIFNFNSYVESIFYLSKVPDETNEKAIWKITDSEFSDNLNFTLGNMTLQHGFNWQVMPRDFTQSGSPEQILTKLDGENPGPRIIIITEKGSQKNSIGFVDCSKEQISNCSDFFISGREAKTALFNQGLAKTLYIKDGDTSYVFFIQNTDNSEEREEIEDIINSIQFY